MYQSKRIAVKLQSKSEAILKKGHPWIFSESIAKAPEEAQTGDVAVIFSQRDNKVIGVGLYDAESPIRIKILQANKALQVNSEFFDLRIQNALTKRKEHIHARTNAYRLVYGEADGLPGIIIDTYDGVVVLKLYSGIWLPFLDQINAALVSNVAIKCIVLRLSRNVSKNHPELADGTTLYGTLENPLVIFKEFDVLFQAHVINGHKTGYFLDHRANRHRVGTIAQNKNVLDVFSYAGGFSVHALVGGAESVTSVDISAQALEVAKENASLNTFKGTHQIVQGDAFEVLQQMVVDGLQFDLVVIDPPSFAKQKSEVDRALKQYQKLAQLGVQLTKKGGVLVLASCSSRIDVPAFEQAHQRGFKKVGIPAKKLLLTQHDWDHIATIPELAYLKTIYYQL